MTNILTVKNIDVSFDNQTVVKNLSFDLEKGENLAIIGPNGSGKTVLLRALLGLLPFKGEIQWAGGVRLGYVPQKIEADRHLPITTMNLLSAKCRVRGLGKSEITWAMDATGLTEKIAGTPVGHLSGGQFQRALIAFALLGHPDVLLLDEPTASIDEPGEAHIYELIHGLQDKFGMTTMLVSHDLSFVYRYATKVLCLNRTNICFGAPEEALSPQMLAKLFGGPHKYYHHLHNER